MRTGGVWLCPAPVAVGVPVGRRCLAPLPCLAHEIPNASVGQILHGNAYLVLPPSPWDDVPHIERGRTVAPAAPRRRRRLLLLALAVFSAVLVVSCMGDAAFTGKALLTIAAVAATTSVLLIDLAHNRNGATP